MAYPNEVQAFYYETLKWCGCGNPEDALGLMRNILRLLKARSDANSADDPYTPYPKSGWAKYTAELDAVLGDGPLGLSYLYMLDALELTEHGGSVGGCWLTSEGERVLSLLETDLDAAMSEDD